MVAARVTRRAVEATLAAMTHHRLALLRPPFHALRGVARVARSLRRRQTRFLVLVLRSWKRHASRFARATMRGHRAKAGRFLELWSRWRDAMRDGIRWPDEGEEEEEENEDEAAVAMAATAAAMASPPSPLEIPALTPRAVSSRAMRGVQPPPQPLSPLGKLLAAAAPSSTGAAGANESTRAHRTPRNGHRGGGAYALAPVPSDLDTTATATTTTTSSSSSSKIEPPRKRPSVAVYLPATPAGATVPAAAPSSIALSSASSTSSSSSSSSQHRSRVASTSKSPLHPDSPLWSLTSTAVAERHGRISGLRSGWRAWRASATPYTRRSRRSHSLRVLRKRCAAALILWGRVAAAAIAREANVEASLNARRRRHLEAALFGKWLPYVCEQVTRRGGKLGDWPAGSTQQVGPSPTRRAEAHYCAASQRAAWGRWAACTDRAEAEASRQHAADRFRDRRGSATAIRTWGRMAASVKALASLLVTAAAHHSCRTLKPSIGRWSSGIRHLAARDQANSLADGSAASACLRRGLRSLRRSAERLAVLREAVEGLDAHAAAFSSASVWARWAAGCVHVAEERVWWEEACGVADGGFRLLRLAPAFDVWRDGSVIASKGVARQVEAEMACARSRRRRGLLGMVMHARRSWEEHEEEEALRRRAAALLVRHALRRLRRAARRRGYAWQDEARRLELGARHARASAARAWARRASAVREAIEARVRPASAELPLRCALRRLRRRSSGAAHRSAASAAVRAASVLRARSALIGRWRSFLLAKCAAEAASAASSRRRRRSALSAWLAQLEVWHCEATLNVLGTAHAARCALAAAAMIWSKHGAEEEEQRLRMAQAMQVHRSSACGRALVFWRVETIRRSRLIGSSEGVALAAGTARLRASMSAWAWIGASRRWLRRTQSELRLTFGHRRCARLLVVWRVAADEVARAADARLLLESWGVRRGVAAFVENKCRLQKLERACVRFWRSSSWACWLQRTAIHTLRADACEGARLDASADAHQRRWLGTRACEGWFEPSRRRMQVRACGARAAAAIDRQRGLDALSLWRRANVVGRCCAVAVAARRRACVKAHFQAFALLVTCSRRGTVRLARRPLESTAAHFSALAELYERRRAARQAGERVAHARAAKLRAAVVTGWRRRTAVASASRALALAWLEAVAVACFAALRRHWWASKEESRKEEKATRQLSDALWAAGGERIRLAAFRCIARWRLLLVGRVLTSWAQQAAKGAARRRAGQQLAVCTRLAILRCCLRGWRETMCHAQLMRRVRNELDEERTASVVLPLSPSTISSGGGGGARGGGRGAGDGDERGVLAGRNSREYAPVARQHVLAPATARTARPKPLSKRYDSFGGDAFPDDGGGGYEHPPEARLLLSGHKAGSDGNHLFAGGGSAGRGANGNGSASRGVLKENVLRTPSLDRRRAAVSSIWDREPWAAMAELDDAPVAPPMSDAPPTREPGGDHVWRLAAANSPSEDVLDGASVPVLYDAVTPAAEPATDPRPSTSPGKIAQDDGGQQALDRWHSGSHGSQPSPPAGGQRRAELSALEARIAQVRARMGLPPTAAERARGGEPGMSAAETMVAGHQADASHDHFPDGSVFAES